MLTIKLLPEEKLIIDSTLEIFIEKITKEEITTYLNMERDIFQREFIAKNFGKIQVLINKKISYSERIPILVAEACVAFMEKIHPTLERTNEQADQIMKRGIQLYQKHM